MAQSYIRLRLPPAVGAEVDRLGGSALRLLRQADRLPELGGLGLAWATVVGIGVATAGMLQALGPPPHASASQVVAANHPAPRAAGAPRLAAAQHPAPPAISTLLARVQGAISDNPDGPPPGDEAARTLQQVADALPAASDGDRALATEVASDLYDRAKIALDAGRIDEEQRWLALGSILAPPPDLAPTEQLAEQSPAKTGAGSGAEPREDVTPNEAEADGETTPAGADNPAPRVKLEVASSKPPTDAPARLADEAVPAQPAAARAEPTVTELPALRRPGARPPSLPEADSGTMQLAAMGPRMNPGSADVIRSSQTEQRNASSDTGTQAPKRSPVATVAGFYAALHRGDGFAAQDFIVPEKRGRGHYAPSAMSRFYGGLAEPLVLLGAKEDGDNQVMAQYRFRSGAGVCNGSAVVELRNDMIQSIAAKNHC